MIPALLNDAPAPKMTSASRFDSDRFTDRTRDRYTDRAMAPDDDRPAGGFASAMAESGQKDSPVDRGPRGADGPEARPKAGADSDTASDPAAAENATPGEAAMAPGKPNQPPGAGAGKEPPAALAPRAEAAARARAKGQTTALQAGAGADIAEKVTADGSKVAQNRASDIAAESAAKLPTSETLRTAVDRARDDAGSTARRNPGMAPGAQFAGPATTQAGVVPGGDVSALALQAAKAPGGALAGSGAGAGKTPRAGGVAAAAEGAAGQVAWPEGPDPRAAEGRESLRAGGPQAQTGASGAAITAGAATAGAPPPAVALAQAQAQAEARAQVVEAETGRLPGAPGALGAEPDFAAQFLAPDRQAVVASTATAAPPTAGAETARQIASQIGLAVTQQGGKTVEIALHPEELGRVRFSLTAGDGTVMMALQADRAETQDLLRRHIDVLAAELRALGYENLQFSFDGSAQGGDRQDDPADPVTTTASAEDTDLPASAARVLPGGTGLDLRL